jgi:hypothetical protein
MQFLPNLFTPQLMMRAEALLYTYAERLAPDTYKGGLWEFYTLSNDGGYAAPVVENQDPQANSPIPSLTNLSPRS